MASFTSLLLRDNRIVRAKLKICDPLKTTHIFEVSLQVLERGDTSCTRAILRLESECLMTRRRNYDSHSGRRSAGFKRHLRL